MFLSNPSIQYPVIANMKDVSNNLAIFFISRDAEYVEIDGEDNPQVVVDQGERQIET